jgi:hypothetical protein
MPNRRMADAAILAFRNRQAGKKQFQARYPASVPAHPYRVRAD